MQLEERSEPRWRQNALSLSREAHDRVLQRRLERGERILDAARTLLSEAGGSRNFTMKELCERAGVSLGTLYSQFPSKEEVLLAVMEGDSRAGVELVRGGLPEGAG